MLEIYRYFRMNYFKKIDGFYKEFFNIFSINIDYFNLNNYEKIFKKIISDYKKKSPYLSYNDIKFRIIRDYILENNDYNSIMLLMFKKYNFNYKPVIKKIFITKGNLNQIKRNGHTIGLHSHNHPTRMNQLSYNEQLNEYKTNKKIIKDILGIKEINSMSHPNGNYNKDTLKILTNLKLSIGFKPTMLIDENMKKINNTNLEVARENHANILRQIKK